eukprot:TRINITY_DN20548_c0_g1_i1.p1 TRINITY_DN20548_c0_g1~~TRINITY_DN20548_c0_g1_i1.p1  ORF type:complete len:803 (+),score=152.58 TRINITY_DN20548_c0_g1_i1:45-2411(+)
MAPHEVTSRRPGGVPPRPAYPERFHVAAQYAAVPGTVQVDSSAAHPLKGFSDLHSLMLYALYQQATNGPCTTPKPWFLDIVESAKWSSWKELGNLSQVEAMRLFVRYLDEEAPDWWVHVQSAYSAPSSEKSLAVAHEQVRQQQSAPKSNGTPLPISSYEEEEEADAPLAAELHALPEKAWKSIQPGGKRPTPRYQHGAVIMEQRMYVIGGNSTGKYLKDMQVLDLTSLTWIPVDLPPSLDSLPPTAGHSVIRRDNRTFLAIGGYPTSGTDKFLVLSFDIYTYHWTVLTTRGQAPSARGGHSVSRVGQTLWLFGGEDRRRQLHNSVYRLDLDTLVWQPVLTSGLAPSPRCEHAATIHAERALLVFGGGSHSNCYNDLHILNLLTLEWSRVVAGGSIPSPRAGHAGVLMGTQWFIAGGGDTRGGSLDTSVLDLEAFTWSKVATAPLRTSIGGEGLSLVGMENGPDMLLLAFGGYNGRHSNEVFALRPSPPASSLAWGTQSDQQDFTGEEEDSGLASANARQGSEVHEEGDEPRQGDAESAAAAAAAAAEEAAWAQRLEEAEAKVVKAEKQCLDTQAEAQWVSGKARADAWEAIWKVQREYEALKIEVEHALEGQLAAEKAASEAQEPLRIADEAAQKAQAEAVRLRKQLAECKEEAKLRGAVGTSEGVNAHVARLQKEIGATRGALGTTSKSLESLRSKLEAEQERSYHLEVEVTKLRQQVLVINAMEEEKAQLLRQLPASDFSADGLPPTDGLDSKGGGGLRASPSPSPSTGTAWGSYLFPTTVPAVKK